MWLLCGPFDPSWCGFRKKLPESEKFDQLCTTSFTMALKDIRMFCLSLLLILEAVFGILQVVVWHPVVTTEAKEYLGDV